MAPTHTALSSIQINTLLPTQIIQGTDKCYKSLVCLIFDLIYKND